MYLYEKQLKIVKKQQLHDTSGLMLVFIYASKIVKNFMIMKNLEIHWFISNKILLKMVSISSGLHDGKRKQDNKN